MTPSYPDTKGICMSAINDLAKYVQQHANRGTCRCGKCADHPGTDQQPDGHTADVVFFQVSSQGAEPERLRSLVAAAHKGHYGDVDCLDGQEHSYLELGGWIGDQGLALKLMGLGSVLGLWQLLTPKMLPGLSPELEMHMAQSGMVTIQAPAIVPATR